VGVEAGSTAALTVAFRTLGCKVNRVESEQIAAELLGGGVLLVAEDEAQVVVINTCTVTGEADAKARKAIRHALKATSHPIVVVTGCLAALDTGELRAISPRVVVEADKERVAGVVATMLGANLGPGAATRRPVRVGEGFRTRAMIKIEDGCDNFCSYCIVPYARGVPRAVSFAEVVDSAASLVDEGVAEIVLSGVNIGRYDDAGRDVADLVAAVASTGVARLRLSSIEPPDLTARLLDVLGETPSVCQHLHVPLQSGSDDVLGAMSRTYTIAEYEARIEAARSAIAGLAVTTDVIAGFPGESERDHALTIEAARRIGFAKLHVFRYSERSGTAAAQMEQLTPDVRSSRAAELREVGERLREEHIASRAGSTAELLVESVAAGVATGTTRDYIRVSVEAEAASPGDCVAVRLGEQIHEPIASTRCAEQLRA